MNLRLLPAIVLAALVPVALAQSTPPELFQAAVAAATEGDRDAALESLERAASGGFTGLRQLRDAEAFADLRDEPRFIEVMRIVRRNVFPCEDGEKYAAFDFWIGSWDVFSAGGQQAGTNRIRRVENGCVLEETWVGSSGITGRSLNYYDARKDKWRQHWVSATGLLIDIEGNLEDDSMVMTGQVFYPATGQQADFRGTWTPLEDGRVRQFFEQYDADGEVWNPWFEGFYVRTGD